MTTDPYRGDCLDSIIELVDGKFAELEEFECGECGEITKAATWQAAMDAHDCPIPTLTSEEAYAENVLRGER